MLVFKNRKVRKIINFREKKNKNEINYLFHIEPIIGQTHGFFGILKSILRFPILPVGT